MSANQETAKLEAKPLSRYLAALLQQCPHWRPTVLPGAEVLAQSPTGHTYLFYFEAQRLESNSASQALASQRRHAAETLVLVALSDADPQAAELARQSGALIWGLSELDFAVMAADLESNAPLAYAGLEVELPQAAPALPTLSQNLTQTQGL